MRIELNDNVLFACWQLIHNTNHLENERYMAVSITILCFKGDNFCSFCLARLNRKFRSWPFVQVLHARKSVIYPTLYLSRTHTRTRTRTRAPLCAFIKFVMKVTNAIKIFNTFIFKVVLCGI